MYVYRNDVRKNKVLYVFNGTSAPFCSALRMLKLLKWH